MKNIKIFFFLICFLTGGNAFASPFYLTVEKSYSTDENSVLRVDFQNKDIPLEIKILKPKNVDTFLDGQLDISRAYEQPSASINAGFYISRGLNKIDSPFDKARRAIHPEFRKLAEKSGLLSPLVSKPGMNIVNVPGEYIIEAPKGFEVIKSFQFAMGGGTKTKDIVPGFGSSSNDDSESFYFSPTYQVVYKKLPKLPSGIYLVQAVQGSFEAQTILQISDLSMQVKQSNHQLVIHLMDRNLKPIENANVFIRDSRNKWFSLKEKTNKSGSLFYTSHDVLDSKLVVKVQKDNMIALASTEFLSTQMAKNNVFIFTDRPIFKPGEKFYYKGIMRERFDEKLRIPSIHRIDSIELVDAKGKQTNSSPAKPVSSFGTFEGEFGLDENQNPGLYQVVAKSGGVSYGGELRVRDYIKPTFYMEITKQEGHFYPGQTVSFEVNAKRYAGGNTQDIRYEVYLYRKKYETPQWVEEAGAGVKTGNDYFGNTAVPSQANQPLRIYSSVEEREAKKPEASEEGQNLQQAPNEEVAPGSGDVFVGSWKTAPSFDANGNAQISISIPSSDNKSDKEEWIYSLMVKAMDAQGSQAILSKNYPVTLSEAYARVNFVNTIVNEDVQNIKALVHATYPDGSLAMNASGEVHFEIEKNGKSRSSVKSVEFTTDAKGNAVVVLSKVPASGKLFATATVDALEGRKIKNPSTSPEAILLVANNEGQAIYDNEQVELYTDNHVVEPNGKVKNICPLAERLGQC